MAEHDFTSELSAASISFSVLKNVKGFPYSSWLAQYSLLSTRRDWYKGEPLEETIDVVQGGKTVKVEKYPLKINLLRGTAKKHASLLIGQGYGSEEVDGQVIRASVKYKKAQVKETVTEGIGDDGTLTESKEVSLDNELETEAEDAISDVMEQSYQAAIVTSAAITSQYLGGAGFSLSYDAKDKEITMNYISGIELFCIPDGPDMFNLSEAWVVKRITEYQAIAYGHKPGRNEKDFYYLEHYTKDTYQISVNGDVIKNDSGVKMEGENVWGFVPIFYIPRIREEVFIGESIITETAKGLIKEINLRVADIGDATSSDTHADIVAGNLKQDPIIRQVGTRSYIDLGSGSALTGKSDAPFMQVLQTSSSLSATVSFIQELMTMYRREVNHPSVADGEDAGSQRSSLTITTRMFPMIAEVEMQRRFWSAGFSAIAKAILKMANLKGLYGITSKHLDNPKVSIKWQTMMIRDRQELVTEAVSRFGSGLSSRVAMNDKLGDVNAEEEEIEIASEKEESAKRFAQQSQSEDKSAEKVAENS